MQRAGVIAMEQKQIRDSESGSVQVQRAVRTPGPWHQYAKTVKAGNPCGFDVTADGNHVEEVV